MQYDNSLNPNDDYYNLTASLSNTGKHLRKNFAELKAIIESCNKSANKLQNSLGNIKSQSSSLSSSMHSITNSMAKIGTNMMMKSLSGGNSLGGSSMQNAGMNNLSTNFIGDMMQNFLGGMRANGGNVSANIPYLVGERGAEVFTPHTSGYISPSGQSSANSGKPINIVMNISTPDVESFKHSQNQIFSQMNHALQKSSRNL